MAKRYAKGKHAVGICRRSGRKMLLNNMVADGYYPNMIVDPAYYEPKHPQESLPSIEDPVALYRPAPDGDRVNQVVIIETTALDPWGFGLSGAVSFETVEAPGLTLKADGDGFIDGVTNVIPGIVNATGFLEEGCMIVLVLWSSNGSGDIIPDTGNPVNILWSPNTSAVQPNMNNTACFFYEWQNGDPETFGFVWESAITNRLYYKWYAVSNYNAQQPFDNLTFATWDTQTGFERAGMERVFPGVVPQMNSSQSALIDINIWKEDALPDAPFDLAITRSYEDLLSQEITNNAAVNRRGWMHLGFARPSTYDETLNLLPDCRPERFANWDSVNAGASTGYDSAGVVQINISDGVAPTGPHGIEKEATLSAGRHCFAVYYGDSLSLFGLTYVDPGSIEHGIVLQGDANLASQDTGGLVHFGTTIDSQTVGSGWDDYYFFMSQRTADVGILVYCFVDVVTPGNYKFRISTANGANATTAVRVYDSTATSDSVGINMATLSVGDMLPSLVFTDATAKTTPATTGPGFMNRNFFRASPGLASSGNYGTGAYGMSLSVELCGPEIAPAQFLSYPGAGVVGTVVDQTDRLTCGVEYGGRVWQNTSTNIAAAAYINRMVFPAGAVTGATGKYYCEMVWQGGAGTAAQDHPGVFVQPLMGKVHGHLFDSADWPGFDATNSAASYMGFFGTIQRRTYSNVAGSTWSATAGDIIGVALDLTAGTTGEVEFFKNGVSQGTVALDPLLVGSEKPANDRPWQVGCMMGDSSGGFGVTAVLKAPFNHTKPAGFQDWDYTS